MITSRQLEYVRAVARELHFTRAAQVLGIAQPALSQQIRKLERQLGVVLFERSNHRVELTAAGAALLAGAERILADLATVEQELRGWADGTLGRIRLGCLPGLTSRLARVLREFGAACPGVEVELRELTTAEMTLALRAGQLDAAIVARRTDTTETDGDGLVHRSLGIEPLVLISAAPVGAGAGAAPVEPPVPLGTLHGTDLVGYPVGSTVREIVLSALTLAGATPRFRFETRDPAAARALAAFGVAAAIVPRAVAEGPGHPVRIRRLTPEPQWMLTLAWSAERRPGSALATFLDFAGDHPALLTPAS
ncbi:LysR family transcriptional regulator [Kitasatospora sp. NBC_01250]|uniref:LysR family transcriptional regulator n=1 Tax=unclassified Kitasatospora TaxID=2633591 RepID=UPI002E115AF6|nr:MULTISPECIES: LysR family transcriptional regulator [unclassified Kitasatospora]WSJ70154.1 LysR family transcriptional regulator [Kitasatospora sp. NBC_01302]